ncbi:MAG: 2-amino-4-hydroxy-6-hydroxymethyldihydropteridine diphosphokinase [Zetaproteobacteria bacterium]|nr:2-amino-4-hydroxy-6-hydroxymethyldihydropteridine diphosphokinase [Zetaproteobacteria bacterium]
MGNMLHTLTMARADIVAHHGCQLLASSRLYTTAPIGGPEQGDYLNGVIQIKTSEQPMPLLQRLLEIERTYGRERLVHWGARTLDLDLIAYDDQMITSERLTLPHPRMHERLFVLEPLHDIVPHWIHPTKHLSLQAMRKKLRHQQRIELAQAQWP